MPVIALIRKLEHFVRLSMEDKALLQRVAAQQIRRLGPHEDLIREGEKPDAIKLIHEGWACRYKVLEDGRRQIIAFFLPGDLCDMNIFLLREMDHSIAAVTALAFSDVSRRSFEELMHSTPRIAQALEWDALVTMGIQREWTVNIGQRDALERVAHLLCELFIRLRTAGLTDGNSCDFPLTQTELGEALGLSAVHVNRTLQELRAAGLIILKDRTLTIPDEVALQEAAMFNPAYLHLDHDGRHLDANEP